MTDAPGSRGQESEEEIEERHLVLAQKFVRQTT